MSYKYNQSKNILQTKKDSIHFNYDQNRGLTILNKHQDTLLNLSPLELEYSYIDDPYFIDFKGERFTIIHNFHGGSSNLNILLAYILDEKETSFIKIETISASSMIQNNELKEDIPDDVFLYKGEDINLTDDGKISFKLPLYIDPSQPTYYKTLTGEYKLTMNNKTHVLIASNFKVIE